MWAAVGVRLLLRLRPDNGIPPKQMSPHTCTWQKSLAHLMHLGERQIGIVGDMLLHGCSGFRRCRGTMTILDSLHKHVRGNSRQIDEEIRETRFIDVKHSERPAFRQSLLHLRKDRFHWHVMKGGNRNNVVKLFR